MGHSTEINSNRIDGVMAGLCIITESLLEPKKSMCREFILTKESEQFICKHAINCSVNWSLTLATNHRTDRFSDA